MAIKTIVTEFTLTESEYIYLPTLQERQVWNKTHQNEAFNDVVLVACESPRIVHDH